MSKVPAGWEKVKFKKIIHIEMGFAFKSKDFSGAGIPLIRMGNLYQNQLQLHRSPVYLPCHYLDKYERYSLKGGDIVMSMTGTMGKRDYGYAVQLPGDVGKCLLNQRVVKIEPKADLYKSYLLFLLHSEEVLSQLYKYPGGTKQANLAPKQIQQITVLLPPLPEQRKIAKILSTWDKAIAVTEGLIAASEEQKRGLMQDLLTGKRRFGGFEGAWRRVRLGDVCTRIIERNNGQSINVVTISAQQGLIRQEDYFSKRIASDVLDNYYILKKGQFAYNKSYSKGYPMGAIKRLNKYDDAVVTSLYICFEKKLGANANVDYLEHYFESGLLNKELMRIAAEGGRAHGLLNVKPTDFFNMKFKIPSLAEQEKIAAVLSAADREIELLREKLAYLKEEKKGLMQVLLTGKRRVVVEEEVAVGV